MFLLLLSCRCRKKGFLKISVASINFCRVSSNTQDARLTLNWQIREGLRASWTRTVWFSIKVQTKVALVSSPTHPRVVHDFSPYNESEWDCLSCCNKCPKTTLKVVCTIFQVFWQSYKNRLKFKAFFTDKSSCFFVILEPFVDIHCAKGNVSNSAKCVICVPLNKVIFVLQAAILE